MSCLVKMTDCSFDEYILSLCVCVLGFGCVWQSYCKLLHVEEQHTHLIYFVPIFIPHQLSVRHNLRVSCNCAACFFKREIQVVPIHVYICAACFFKREIQVALFTFTHLHRHLISSPSPIHLFTFNNSPFFTFTNSSLYLHQFTILYLHQFISLPSPIHHSLPSPIHLFTFTNIHHLFICMFTFTFKHSAIVLDRLVYVFNHM